MNYQLVAIVASLLSVLLTGGLIGVILRYRIQARTLTVEEKQGLREQQRQDFDLLLRVVTGQRDEAFKVIDSYDSKFQNMELEIHGMRLSADMDPFPNWIVDLEGRYIFVNREFEKQFLEPEGMIYRQMIGEPHSKIWPDSFCQTLEQLDQVAKRRPDGRARAVTTVGDRQITVHKFPIRIKGIPVAFAGYITDVEPLPPGGDK